MNVLITGANGFIGSNLTKLLVNKGYTVTAMVLAGTPVQNLAGIACKIAYADITEPESLTGVIKNIDLVYHLAALPSAGWGSHIFKVNYLGTKNMLDAAVANGVKRFVFMSSLVVHGFKNFENADESTPIIRPGFFTRPYIKSKIKCEELIAAYTSKIETVIIRPGFQIFGLNDMLASHEILNRIENKRLLAYVGNGNNKLGYVYVDNLAYGLLCAGTHANAKGNAYVIADNDPPFICTKQLFTLFADKLGIPVKVKSIPKLLLYPIAFTIDLVYMTLLRNKMPIISTYIVNTATHNIHFTAAKAVNQIGYTPQVKLNQGLQKTVEWYRTLK